MERRTTLKDIAALVGVHHATVSRALRGSPNISAEVREKIRAAAAQLGYTPDPMMSALAAYRAANQPVRYKETLAFIWPEQTHAEVAASTYLNRFSQGAIARAKELGCLMDTFSIREAGPVKTIRAIEARGIRGIVIGPHHRLSAAHLRLPFERFAAVSMSSALRLPRLHHARHDHFKGMCTALHELKKRGYRRAALVIGEQQDRILERRYSAAFLTHHPLGRETARHLLFVTEVAGPEAVLRALESKPDAVIMSYSPNGMPPLRCGQKPVPLVSLDLLPGDDRYSGICQQMEQVAANAVDIVLEQIIHGRRGVPQFPKTILGEGEWRDAPAIA